MKGLMWIVGWMAMAVTSAAYAKPNPFADVVKADKIKVAEAAELKGDLARIHQQYGEAVGFYRSAIKSSPNDAELHNKLGITYLQLHEFGSARKSFGKAIKYDPRYVNAYNNMGATEYLSKRYRPAINYLKRALELDETNAPAHLNMAESW